MLDERPQHVLAALQGFLATPLNHLLADSDPAILEAHLLQLFQQTASQVPAYQAFLETQGIDPAQIRTLADFQALPLLTKANYLQRYPLSDLCRQGQLTHCDWIAVSSGSTGQPSFWPRWIGDELRIAQRFEQVFYDSFRADQRTSLVVVCFSLGTWVGGLYTANCCRYLALKGYPLTLVTPGNNPAEIFRAVQALGSQFDQVVLCGYPPFLKDVIDSGLAQGVDWPRYRVKLLMAGEVFSEAWRSLVAERLGSHDLCHDFVSLYGTADAGVLGNETPLSICIRRYLADRPALARQLFGGDRPPTLLQYDPTSRYFEVQAGTLLFSGDNGIPLIRYHIADEGGLIGYDELLATLKAQGFDPLASLKDSSGIRRLPFVYVFGRSHFVVSYYGANLYPEQVGLGLEQPTIRDWVTGKFVMTVEEDVAQNRQLWIRVELAAQIAPAEVDVEAIAQSIWQQLRQSNSEFANYVPGDRQVPVIVLCSLADPEWFPQGVKHRYSR